MNFFYAARPRNMRTRLRALDLPSADKDAKFQYLANLMEDASDFGFDNAKACHAVVLTTMEADKLTWSDTDALDRIRRSKAQRNTPVNGQESTSRGSVDSKARPTKNCKFFQLNKCGRHEGSHVTAGTLYLHVCERCGGSHTTVSCRSRQSKN